MESGEQVWRARMETWSGERAESAMICDMFITTSLDSLEVMSLALLVITSIDSCICSTRLQCATHRVLCCNH